MAPPTPTTTPMTVLRVCGDMLDVLEPFCDRPGVLVTVVAVVYDVSEPSVLVWIMTLVLVSVTGSIEVVDEVVVLDEVLVVMGVVDVCGGGLLVVGGGGAVVVVVVTGGGTDVVGSVSTELELPAAVCPGPRISGMLSERSALLSRCGILSGLSHVAWAAVARAQAARSSCVILWGYIV